MKRVLIILGVIILAGAALAYFAGERFLMNRAAASVEKQSLADLEALLSPSMIVQTPEVPVDGPQPVLVLLHGCSGLTEIQQRDWADMANELGYTSVIVASNKPRGFDREQSLAQVCRGQALLGQERAGDVLAALSHVGKSVEIDPDRIVLAGWSHGAWTAMDFLTMDMDERRPAGLSDPELDAPEIKGAVLFYPHCGLGSRTRLDGWTQSPDVLALIAEADTIVDHKACLAVMDDLEATGVDIDLTLYEGAEHAFDYRYLPAERSHWFNEEYADDAGRKVRAFLEAQLD